jgi:hypothetical protein
MKLVFMLEEPSMKEVLESILPRLLPDHVDYLCIPHQGKSDLEKSIPIKLRAWREPNVHFVIMRDQDASDCRALKQQLALVCFQAGRSDCLVRIVCRELESWFLADLKAVELGTCVSGIATKQNKIQFRNPDANSSPSRALKKLIPGYQKISGARAIAPHLDLGNTRSRSFAAFVEGVTALVAKSV